MANSTNSDKTGIVAYDGTGTFNGRTITSGTAIVVANGDGVSGDPVINADSTIATTYNADAGSATPAANALTVTGGTGIATSGAGSTLTIDADAAVATSYATDSGTATPVANTLTLSGGTGIDTSGTGGTVTFDVSGDVATTYTCDSGSATPAANNINVLGSGGTSTSGSGSTITVTSSGGGGVTPSNSTVYLFDDLLAHGGSTRAGLFGWIYDNAENFNTNAYAEQGHPGIYTLRTVGFDESLYTSTQVAKEGCITLGGGVITAEWLIKMPAASDVTNNYTFYAGLMDNFGTSLDNGLYFTYNHAVNSGNWVANAENAGTTSTSNSSVFTASAWVKLTIEINAGATSVTFKVNGTAISGGAITTNIPTAQIGPLLWVDRTAGTAERLFKADYFSLRQDLTVAR